MKLGRKRDKLAIEIDNLIQTLITMDPTSEEYDAVADNLNRLIEAQNGIKGKKFGVSAETTVKIACTIIQSLLVLNYEKVNIITSKAWNLVPKIRL